MDSMSELQNHPAVIETRDQLKQLRFAADWIDFDQKVDRIIAAAVEKVVTGHCWVDTKGPTMSDQWIEGEPDSDGLYACVWTSRPGHPNVGVGKLLVRIREGKRYATSHENVEGNPFECSTVKILRHYRLPEPTRPLELRRFRAKYAGHQVIGVKVQGGAPHLCDCAIFSDCLRCFIEESRLTGIVWEDQP